MKISILTLFPAMMQSFFSESIIKRAMEKGVVEIEIVNIRDFAVDDYGSVDDRPHGGGAGMVMRVDVIAKAIDKLKVQSLKSTVILTSPRGRVFNQVVASDYARNVKHLVIVCGHYEGFDERVTTLVDEEVSLGDFVMTGGEITAAAITDSVVRLLSGVIKQASPEEESFFEVSVEKLEEILGTDEFLAQLKINGVTAVRLLEYPHYTRPEEFMGKKVPEVLLSGNHKEIEKWRLKSAYEVTKTRRPDLLKSK